MTVTLLSYFLWYANVNVAVLYIVRWAFVYAQGRSLLQAPSTMEPDVFFGTKPFCRLSEALEAAADIAQNAEDDVDVVIIPPDPSPETDEEEGDEDCTVSAPVNDVSG